VHEESSDPDTARTQLKKPESRRVTQERYPKVKAILVRVGVDQAYGDNGKRRGSAIAKLASDDLLVFYAGMRSITPPRKLQYALVGLFVIQGVVPAIEVPPERRHENAHTRWTEISENDVVVRGKPGLSGRFNRSIPIGEWRDRAYRVRKDPTRSLSHEEDVENRARLHTDSTNAEDYAMNTRRALVLILLVLAFAILMYGLMAHGWGFREIGSLFLWMGIVIPVVGGMPVTTMIEKNIDGMKSVVIAVVMMSAAQIIYFILSDARILDTMLNYLAGYLGKVPEVVIAYVMFGISALTAALLGSASGTAATLMPILAPLADVLHFSKQIVVLAFQFATGAFNFWMPWDGIAFTVCSMAGVKFFKYIRYTAKFAVLVYFPTALLMLFIAVVIKYK